MDHPSSGEDFIFTFKITLLGTAPPVWRRVKVLDCINLRNFHYIVQCVMGWDNSHLHQYFCGKERYGAPSADNAPRLVRDETQFVLADIFKRTGMKVRYEYDFGDSWLHEIILEKSVPATADHTHPICLGGQRNCPPEDIGGIWGYTELLESVSNPSHPRRSEFEEWLEEIYDPDRFELSEINSVLANMKYISAMQ
jgi:hypothetical protein